MITLILLCSLIALNSFLLLKLFKIKKENIKTLTWTNVHTKHNEVRINGIVRQINEVTERLNELDGLAYDPQTKVQIERQRNDQLAMVVIKKLQELKLI